MANLSPSSALPHSPSHLKPLSSSPSAQNSTFVHGLGNSHLIFSGTIQKWTNYFGLWQWRFLKVENGLLTYYKSKNEQHLGCKGSLSLAFASVDMDLLDPTRFDVNLPKVNAKWFFKADIELERDKWVAIIKSNIEYALKMHNHVDHRASPDLAREETESNFSGSLGNSTIINGHIGRNSMNLAMRNDGFYGIGWQILCKIF